MKFDNIRITSKLVILVAVTMVGLCAAGILAAYMVRSEMLSARTEQLKSIVELGANVAANLQKEVAAGKISKEAASAEPGPIASVLSMGQDGRCLSVT